MCHLVIDDVCADHECTAVRVCVWVVCVPAVHAGKHIAGLEHSEFFMCLCLVCVLRWSFVSLLLWYTPD